MQEKAINTLTPIVKVVGDFCNNRCGYCFFHDKDQFSPKKMSINLLASFIRQHAEIFSGNIGFIWHGGEPLLAGLDFFNKIISLQEEYIKNGRIIHNSIQTNGILITDKWATFFKKHAFGVGVSLDGDKESHDKFRVDHVGRGTFDKTMRGIEILRRHQIEPSIIQTATCTTTTKLKENFNFFTDILKLRSFSINAYSDISGINKFMAGQGLSNDDLARYIIQYIDLWLNYDDTDLRIREIDNFLSGIYGKRALNCSFNGSCFTYYTVDSSGMVYPCDRLSSNVDLCFGDLNKQSLAEILFGEKRQTYIGKINTLNSDCATCKWQHACNNGCTFHRIGNIDGKYYYCEARKAIFSYLLDKTIKIARNNSSIKLPCANSTDHNA